MSYIVTTFDGSTSYTVVDQTIDSSQTPLNLIGRGAVGYGLGIAQDLVNLLGNFAAANSTTLNTLFPPRGMAWFDKTALKLRVNVGTAGSPVWQVVGTATTSGNTPPSGPTVGELWYDTGVNELKAWNGSAFIVIGPLAASGVSAGTYNSVTVNAQGLVTAGFPVSSSPFVRLDANSSPTVDNTFVIGDVSHRYANIHSTTFTGLATSADYADVAERYAASEPLAAGDLVALGGSAEIRKTVGYMSPEAFGVISTAPALRMNEGAGDDESHPFVALTGRVPCKVLGKVSKGQRIVASHISGVAMGVDLSSETYIYSVVGRAVAEKTSDGVGLVEIIVGVK